MIRRKERDLLDLLCSGTYVAPHLPELDEDGRPNSLWIYNPGTCSGEAICSNYWRDVYLLAIEDEKEEAAEEKTRDQFTSNSAYSSHIPQLKFNSPSLSFLPSSPTPTLSIALPYSRFQSFVVHIKEDD